MSGHIVQETPSVRRLRGFAFDPSLSLGLDTISINETEYLVPWEDLSPGPVGDYLEVIDVDPSVKGPSPNPGNYEGEFYVPVNLDDPAILSDNGLAPSDSNPQFHQQMVYAVAMTTIKNFESALGRKILWSEKPYDPKRSRQNLYVDKLRIYPHALRQANAYYSPAKKALLFGYFKSYPVEKHIHMPNSYVFTCLSHDIIAHEVTHAILDGINRYYTEPTNPDVLAFHEAFADIVALFQHFTFPHVLKHQIALTRGNLESQNLLGKLAQEFGSAIGSYGSLRDAIGKIDEKTKEWKRIEADPSEYETVVEPHKRGSILVAAVFDAFLNIYKRRVADLIRIATDGRGILPEGEIHPDLVNRLAAEASKTAGHILQMCIRAIDYCPPVDITFGAFLRAIITADKDLVKVDKHNYRLAFIEAFKKRGIYPKGIKTLSIESLSFHPPHTNTRRDRILGHLEDFLKDFSHELVFKQERKDIYDTIRKYIAGNRREGIKGLHQRLEYKFDEQIEFENLTGIYLNHSFKRFGINGKKYHGQMKPTFSVTHLRVVTRVGPDGNKINQIVFSIVQTARIIVEKNGNRPYRSRRGEKEYMKFRGGATLIFDLDTFGLKYCISKPLLKFQGDHHVDELDVERLLEQDRFQNDFVAHGAADFEKYFNIKPGSVYGEPFALLHNH